MKHCVIGGGNIGTLMAAEMAHRGETVTIYTSSPGRFSDHIDVYDNQNNFLYRAEGIQVSGILETAVSGVDYIWITLPAFMFEHLSKELSTIVKPGQKIGIVPGTGGAEYAFGDLIQKGCTLFGFQRTHSIARLKDYGKSVFELGRKKELYIAAVRRENTEEVCQCTERFLGIPCRRLPNYLCVTLTPSNAILHTSRLYSMFREYRKGIVYKENFLFYEGWDDLASQVLFACDDELQLLCRKLHDLDLKEVLSLKTYYESETAADLTKKIHSITAFHGILSPMKREGEGWMPDFDSRYFRSDFCYGLKVIMDIADAAEVDTPAMDRLWNWYIQLPENKETDNVPYFQIPISGMDQLYKIYAQR